MIFKIINNRKLIFATFAAIAYMLVLVFFFSYPDFKQIWTLYVGNFLFGIIVAIYLVKYNNKRNESASVYSMIKAGHVITLMGIVISCLAIALMLLFAKVTFQSGELSGKLASAPSQMKGEKTNGLLFILFADAIIGNIAAGSFVSLLFPFSLTRLQKGEGEPSGDL